MKNLVIPVAGIGVLAGVLAAIVTFIFKRRRKLFKERTLK